MNIKNEISYYLFVFLEKLYKVVPGKLRPFIKKFLASVFYLAAGKRRKIVLKNIEIMTGKRDKKIAKKAFLHFMDNLFEFFENINLSKERLREKVVFENEELVKKFTSESPVIFVTAHYGNWEIMPVAVGAFLTEVDVVVRKLDSEKLNEKIEKSRKRFGVNVYDKRGGLKNLINSLKKGRNVGILIDQYPGDDKGVVTTFFGRPVRHTEVAAVLSRRFNYPIIVSYVYKNGEGKYVIKFTEAFYTEDIQKSVDRQARATEDFIKKDISRWYLFHRRFRPWEKYE
ncbi:lysophospholipid acyltransferase family protein [Nautilia sp.]